MPQDSVMSRQALQMRLLVTIPRPGKPKTRTTELRLADIASFTGVSKAVLAACAHKHREIDEPLQFQLSSFFILFDRGILVKVLEGSEYIIKRIPRPAGTPEPPRAVIDFSGLAPFIRWSMNHGDH